MSVSQFFRLTAIAVLLSLVACYTNQTNNPDSICYSYGVDFVDEGSYFVNTASNDSFTCVSTFNGCNQDEAEVLFIDPAGDESFCSQIPTLPDDTPELSKCPVLKSQLVSGDYMILILGNNGNGQPYAWERDFYLNCGPQATATYTPTVTFSVTTTPVVTLLSTSTLVVTTTVGPSTTYTVPSTTAKDTVTITPPAVNTTWTKTLTRVSKTWTKSLSITTTTETASCTTVSSVKQDKPCTYSPTLVHPAALVTPTSSAKLHRFTRKGDRAVNVEYARARIAAAKARRDGTQVATVPVIKLGPDEPTLTITASPPVNATTTFTANPTTTSELTIVTSTATTSLPPVTILSGVYTNTITLPTPTKTRFTVAYTTTTSTKTIRATFTTTTTITPSASMAVCATSVGGGWRQKGASWGS
ncbi:hypothetical protein P280DRAFT_472484 [Massarina eburnea CBS 473.64]|uniref:Ig-like domain-containing protein n=1 Tax=Massarina eburnea CBS 473.64 TaxID=1395130 RepID=A0A6A6RNM3_9PLEO|nr:hypothetical protein P280DRAFT_472484 [Massarina eburnea CBS 473.64]